MSVLREYWIGVVYVIEWDLADIDDVPVTEGVVSGTVALPAGGTANMSVDHVDGSATWVLSYQALSAGLHGWRAVASGGADGAIEGSFTVTRSVTGAEPIVLDPTTDVGMIRTLITDVDEAYPLLTDNQISAFLTAEGDNVKRAAALGLEVIARSEALISKKISTQDLSIDGPATAKELRESARALREQAAAEASDYGLDIVPLWQFNSAPCWGDQLL